MLEWKEVKDLPEECKSCQEEVCYNCDAAGKRWQLSREDELKLQRKGLERSIERAQRKIREIDMELLPFSPGQSAALKGDVRMDYDVFWECLQVCFDAGNMDLYKYIWDTYPTMQEELKQRVREQSERLSNQDWEHCKDDI